MTYTVSILDYLIVLGVASTFLLFGFAFRTRGVLGPAIGTLGFLFGLLVGLPSLNGAQVTLSESTLEVRHGLWYNQSVERFDLSAIKSVGFATLRNEDDRKKRLYSAVVIKLTDGSQRSFPRNVMVWESNEDAILLALKRRGVSVR